MSITSEWTKGKIGDICIVGDGAHAKIERQISGIMYLTSKNLKDGRLDITQISYISETDFNKHFRDDSKALTKIKPNDVIFSIIGTIGEPYIVNPRDFFGVSSSVAMLRPDKSVLFPKYLFYWIKNRIFQDALYAIKGGVAQGYVSLEMIRSLPLHYPALSTQEKIASILSNYDDLIEYNTRRIEILEGMAKLVYEEWFVKFRFSGHENVKMISSELGETPEGWKVVKLGSAIELAYGKSLTAKNRTDGPFPVYGSAGIVGTHNEHMVNGPGIIVGRKGNVGSVFWSNEDFFPIDTVYYVKTNIPLHYVYYNLKNQNFINNDAAVPGLSRNQAYLLPFLIPEGGVLIEFEKKMNPIFKEIYILSMKNQNLRKTRDLLLPKLISGEIDVSDLDVHIINALQES
jgi:type I restriction enzyme S subunit